MYLVRTADNCNERFAVIFVEGRTRMLTSFRRRLSEEYGFIAEDPRFVEQAMATVSDVISDVAASVSAADVRINEEFKADAWAIARIGKDNFLGPADGLRAAVILLDIVLAALIGHVTADQELRPCFTLAVQALNESISTRMQAVARACTASALARMRKAQLEERRRIARELHDRVGEVLSVGLRRLDLQEIDGLEAPSGEGSIAREVLVEGMRRLRVVTSDVREPPVPSLEKALIRYLDSVQANAEVRLNISGDEAFAPPVVLDEAFLILQEAVRNALTHASPQVVLVGVELDPKELRAWVLDDGCGFVVTPPAPGGGLGSMRERAALIGGRVSVSSMPGHGTRVDLRIPLPESG
jgi:signal transduction histidine kinase